MPTNQTERTNCGIKTQSTNVSLRSKYGLPSRRLKTTKGALNTYEVSSIRRRNQKEDLSDIWPPLEHTLIETVENLEDGIIFRADNSEIIQDWILYHKYKKSIPFSE